MKYAYPLIICITFLLFFTSCGRNEEGRKSDKKESVGLFPVNMGAKPAL